MEIRPILSSLMRSKTGAVLLALQIAITLAFLVNAFFIVSNRIEAMNRPTGLDTDNQFRVMVTGTAPGYDAAREAPLDVAAIEAVDGVRAATPVNAIPLSGSGWSMTVNNTPEDGQDDGINAALYMVGDHGLDALGVNLVEGRDFTADEVLPFSQNEGFSDSPVIITRRLAERMYPDEPALGKPLYMNLTGPVNMTVVGVVERLVGPWVGVTDWETVYILPRVQEGGSLQFLVRTEPGMRDTAMAAVEKVLQERAGSRLVRGLRSMDDIAARAYEDHRAMSIILGTVSVMLLVVNILGVVGLASFQVNRRRRQIGTRRALGASRWDILRYFMTETGLIIIAGLAVGVFLSIGMNWGMMNLFAIERLELTWLPAAAGLLFVLGQLAVLGPARRAAAIPPAVATRSV